MEPITSLKVSYLLRKGPSENIPERLSDWQNDVDGSGTSYKRFERRLAPRAAVIGWIPVLIESPQHTAKTRAQVREQGLRTDPVVTPLLPMHLLDYQVDAHGEFVWAKLRTCYEEREEDAWDGRAVHVERYRIWTREDVTTYAVRKIDGETESVIEGPVPEAHPYKRVPLEIMKAGETEEDPIKSGPMHGDIALESRRLFNLLSEFDEHIRAQLFAVLVVCGAITPEGESGEMVMGPDKAIPLDSEAKHKHYYLSPDPGLAKVFEDRIERTIKEIYRISRVEYERASGANTSAASKRSEFEKTNAAIAAFAEQTADFKRRLLTFVGDIMGVPTNDVQVTAKDRFDIGDIAEEVDAVLDVLSIEAGPTAQKALRLRAVMSVLPNLDPDTKAAIEAEVGEVVDEENTPEAKRLREQERAMMEAGDDDEPPPDDDTEEDEDDAEAA